MKKTKILSVFAVLLAMGLTACGNGGGGGGGTVSPEECKHEYGEWVITVEPTCTEKGQQEQVCKLCGDKKTKDVKALGHDWGEWAIKTAATCTTDGVEERACKRAGCTAKEERAVKAAHDWDAAQAVAAGTDPADQVGYTLANCKKGDAVKLDITAVDAKFYKGSIKSGTPSGYFKLSSKNDKAYWKFTVAGTKMYKGMLYQRGAMDSFSTNTTKSYASTSTSGDNAPEYTRGNFEVKVNGDALDKTEWIRIPFEELLAEGDDSSAMGDNYSPLAMCPIGECVIQPGLNEITYERLGSYNLIISDLIFIGAEYEHVHAAASTWSTSEEQHWHECTAPGCPTGKLDVANHTFGDAYDVQAATCKAAGSQKRKCTVCDYVKTEVLPQLEHTLGDPYDIVPSTCETAGSQKRKCSVCDEVVTEVLPKTDHNFGDAVDNYAAGEGYIASTAHNCSICSKSALRWNARDFDTTLSSGDLDLTHDGDKSVRFASGNVENKCSTSGNSYSGYTYTLPTEASAGSHIIYKVNVAAAQEKAGLAFKIKNTSGSSGKAPVFGLITNDSSWGCFQNADGSFTQATHRYGLKVNGVEYFLGDDNYGDKSGVTDWFEWPVEFPLQAGVNTIDVFAYAGYRADIYEFELTGLPHVTPSHIHNGDATWLNDETHHWHKCTGEGCPIADGIYDKAEHSWGDWTVISEATVDAAGSRKHSCSICGYEETEVLPQLALKEWVKDELTAAIPNAASLTKTTYANDIIGYKWNSATNAIGNFTYTPSAAGTYTLKLLLSPKSGNEAKTGFWNQDGTPKTKIEVNGVELTAPEQDVDFTVCTVKSATGKDGYSSMMEPVWFEIADVALTASANTITISYLTGGYSYFLCGAAIYK